MLKIKDNVDLKELEKYGFKIKYDENTGKISRLELYYGFPFVDKIKRPFIKFMSKKITFKKVMYNLQVAVPENGLNNNIFLDVLYDLIKDGLVEKVDE